MAASAQSYTTHRKFVPLFHYVAAPILLGNVVVQAMSAVRAPGVATVFQVLVAVALLIGLFFARIFALAAQDRVIRLEERLRLRELLPAHLQPRVNDFSRGQLIALRFASDGELPALAARVLEENLQDRDAIKKLVTQWRVDEHQL